MSTSAEEIDVGISSQTQLAAEKSPKTKITGALLLSVFAAVLGSLQFGYNTGVINAPEKKIKEFMNESHIARWGEPIGADAILNLYSLIVAIFAVGGMIGGLMAGWWADVLGRKIGMLVNTTFGFGAAALMFFSKEADSYEMIICGRFLIGFNCGLYTGLSPLYLTEIASADIRGALGTLHQLGVTIGILTSQVLGFPEVFGNGEFWHVLLGLCVVPCALQLVTMPFCPESPRYLLITKNREKQAMEVLVKLRGTTDVDVELNEMKKEYEAMKSETKITIFHLLKKKSLRMPLLISIIMHLSQQLSGITAIFYYSSSLFTNAGISENTAAHATSGIGAIMVVMTMITIPLMDRLGRRTLHLVGLAGMFFFSILITLSLCFTDQVSWFNYGNIVVSLIYVVFFAIGPGSIPWMIVAELFSQGPRSAAMSLAVLVNWIANFAVGYSFPSMQKELGNFSFLPFTGMLLLLGIFIFKYLPETKNRTFEDIASSWTSGSEEKKPESNPGKHVPQEDTRLVDFSSKNKY